MTGYCQNFVSGSWVRLGEHASRMRSMATSQEPPRGRLCVYCGSSSGAREEYEQAARGLGRTLVGRGYGLVYGGASVGLMGVVADAVLEAGGTVVGVLPRRMALREIAHQGLDELHIVESMHERKQMMERLSSGMIALPGGFGTLEETFEAMTWAQLGYHDKPCGLLNVSGYFDPLLTFLDRTVEERFVKPVHREMMLVADTADDLLTMFEHYEAPAVVKWLDRGDQL